MAEGYGRLVMTTDERTNSRTDGFRYSAWELAVEAAELARLRNRRRETVFSERVALRRERRGACTVYHLTPLRQI
jgi:hypothetical protein